MDRALSFIQMIVGSALTLVSILALAFYFIEPVQETTGIVLSTMGAVFGAISVLIVLR